MESLDLASLQEAAGETEDHWQTSQTYDKISGHCVLGGTFDRIHPGHKILLTSALLRCSSFLTVGVTGPTMLASKTLTELILLEIIFNIQATGFPAWLSLRWLSPKRQSVPSSFGYNFHLNQPWSPNEEYKNHLQAFKMSH